MAIKYLSFLRPFSIQSTIFVEFRYVFVGVIKRNELKEISFIDETCMKGETLADAATVQILNSILKTAFGLNVFEDLAKLVVFETAFKTIQVKKR